MWGARPRATRLVLSTMVATALVFLTIGAVASSALAFGDHDTDSYTANISPSSVLKGSSTTFDVALTNTSSPGSGLSSALITPPLGFRITHASLPTGARGHAYVILNVVVLDGLSVPPGSTLHVAVTATAPSRCNSPFTRWFTWANEGGLFSEDLRLDAGSSSLTTALTCSNPAAGLQFAGQPSNSTVNQDIAPAVTVQLVDSGGTKVTTSGVSITLALGNDPGGNLSGTLTEPTDANGVATFSDLSIDGPGVGYTLTASGGTLTGATSNPFNESQTTSQDCSTVPQGEQCTTDLGTSISDLAISADPAAGTLNESVDVGTPLSCADRIYGGYTGFDTNWYGFSETGTVDKTLSYELFGLNSDQEGLVQMCFGATYPFTTSSDSAAASGTLPDGSPGFIGLLPNCDSTNGLPPCIESIAPFTDDRSGLLVTVTVPGLTVTGAPADPWMHG